MSPFNVYIEVSFKLLLVSRRNKGQGPQIVACQPEDMDKSDFCF